MSSPDGQRIWVVLWCVCTFFAAEYLPETLFFSLLFLPFWPDFGDAISVCVPLAALAKGTYVVCAFVRVLPKMGFWGGGNVTDGAKPRNTEKWDFSVFLGWIKCLACRPCEAGVGNLFLRA